jgi:phage gpG-like protein
MTDSIRLTVDNQEVLDVLGRLADRFSPAGLSPVMQEIGESLAESTQQRFSTSTGPDGKRWAPLAQSTVLARLAKIGGAYAKKSGKLSSKGGGAVMGMKPLVETGILQDTIRYQLIDGGAGVEIGTNRFAGEWEAGAAVHQFGSRNGKIPARPFLGLSGDDQAEVLDILGRFLEEAAGQ